MGLFNKAIGKATKNLSRISGDVLEEVVSPSKKLMGDMQKAAEVPSPFEAEVMTPVSKGKYVGPDGSGYNDWFTGIDDTEISAMEKKIASDYDMSVDELIDQAPEQFANELAMEWSFLKKSGDKSMPYPMDEDFPDQGEMLSDAGFKKVKKLAADKANPFYVDPNIKKKEAADKQAIEIATKEAESISSIAKMGDPFDIQMRDQRDKFIGEVKKLRTALFGDLKKGLEYAEYDDIVLGKTQGEFRAATGREFVPSNKDDVAQFKAIAERQQSLLEVLRNKYKDNPPIKLFHGAFDEKAADVINSKGLSADKGNQAELNMKATSFTKDLNLGFTEVDAFGGRNPSAYLSVEFPYPEYKFLRVDMSKKDYDQMNMNVILKTISGDPKTTRPLGLPRGELKETEDTFVEAEKLKDNYLMKKATEQVNKAQEGLLSLEGDLNKLRGEIGVGTKVNTKKEAVLKYNLIRDYVKSVSKMSKATSVTGGAGQRYQREFVKLGMNSKELKKLAKILRDNGMIARAENIEAYDTIKLGESIKLDPLMKNQIRGSSSNEAMLNLTDKFNRGGLVIR
jgi:hypothetical protein